MYLGSIGYLIFLVNLFALSSDSLFLFSIILIFYSLYFGVLSRDLIEILAEILASNIGVHSNLPALIIVQVF